MAVQEAEATPTDEVMIAASSQDAPATGTLNFKPVAYTITKNQRNDTEKETEWETKGKRDVSEPDTNLGNYLPGTASMSPPGLTQQAPASASENTGATQQQNPKSEVQTLKSDMETMIQGLFAQMIGSV